MSPGGMKKSTLKNFDGQLRIDQKRELVCARQIKI
jgi:hypothetical protein